MVLVFMTLHLKRLWLVLRQLLPQVQEVIKKLEELVIVCQGGEIL